MPILQGAFDDAKKHYLLGLAMQYSPHLAEANNRTAPVPQRKPSLGDRLALYGNDVATPTQSRDFFNTDDFRWAETLLGDDSPTGRPQIHVNDAKFRQKGAGPGYRGKIVELERLHLLKDVDPQRYEQLYSAAMSSPEYREWVQESYRRALADPDYKEARNFEDWHRQSRFDQVLGGYLMAGDKDIPTAKNWSRDLPFGQPLLKELEKLERELKRGPGD